MNSSNFRGMDRDKIVCSNDLHLFANFRRASNLNSKFVVSCRLAGVGQTASCEMRNSRQMETPKQAAS